jgi:vanillate O-demethylase ferredoxin subunit
MTATIQVRVERIERAALDIAAFRLMRHDGSPLPPFTPGSHVDVHLGAGLIRQYSLCNGPDDTDRYLVAVKREPESRGGSVAMHRLKEGDALTIGEPRNNFPLNREAGHHLLLGGGIGITPILSMAKHLQASGVPFQLQYFTRSLLHTAFHDFLSSPPFRDRVHFHYSVEPDALKTYLRHLLWHRPQDGHLYVCGPRPFMDLVEATAAATWPPECVHVEYFSADPLSLAGPQDEFEVRVSTSGRSYVVPQGKTIVQVLGENGIDVEVSCEQGICGTCLTGVLEGTPDHRDMFLTDEEKSACDKMTPCVSRSKSRLLVLDL